MKTSFLKPGFEFVFALSLMVTLVLPAMLMAQTQKDVEIKIENGDTTVNGKNIKELTPKERHDALRDIKHISSDTMSMRNMKTNRVLVFKQRDSTGRRPRISYRRRDTLGHRQMMSDMMIRKDSLGNIVEEVPGGGRIKRDGMPFRDQAMGDMPGRMGGGPMMRYERKNSQVFNYVNTDNDGISTRVTFHISDVSNMELKKMPHVEGSRLEIADLNLVPEFSTGKTLLLFNLPSKAAAEVKLVDSEGKVLWTEKTSAERFIKSSIMGLNGIYYLQVKQGNSVAVKRIMKEE